MDADGDGLRNSKEWMPHNDVDWRSNDTDGDGVGDGVELPAPTYNASNPDTDSDKLADSRERALGTNASSNDSDQDGLLDPTEANGTTDPADNDTDGDLLADPIELHGDTLALNADTDRDGLIDGIERHLGSSPTANDTDSDVVPDGREYKHNTSLTDVDTDGDSLTDPRELSNPRLNPRLADTDGDSLNDTREVRMATLANVSDTDDDTLEDGAELSNETVPTDPDSDDDSLSDGIEVIDHGSDPLNPDTDFDNVTDPIEVDRGILNATNPDVDGDRLEDGTEWYGPTNVTRVDTDDDRLDDWNETRSLPTDPADNDTDADELIDGNETLRYPTEPLDPDTDSDELDDGSERKTYGTNGIDPDTDDDALADGHEVHEYGTEPTINDTDGDRINDGQEINVFGTNATNKDTDGDGIPDAIEIKTPSYDPLDPNPLHNKSPNLGVTGSQERQLGSFIDVFVRLKQSLAKDDPNAGILREYSRAIVELEDVESTGPTVTAVQNAKQAGLYQVLDLVEGKLGPSVSARALKGRLTQAIEVGAKLNSVAAVISDYHRLHEQAEKLVNATGENATAAKIGVVTATTMLVVDAYLLYQTGGTFSLASSQSLAFSITGKIAAKTKLARLAKYCSWKCVGSIERLIHWTLRSAIDIGESMLIGAIINIGYFDATDVELVDILSGLSAEQAGRMIKSVKDILEGTVVEALETAVEKVTTDGVDSFFSVKRPPNALVTEREAPSHRSVRSTGK